MAAEIEWVRNAEVRKRTIAREVFLLAVKKNRLLILNEQATAIWDMLSREALKEKDIVKALQKKYSDVSIKRLSNDVHNLLCDFQRRGFAYYDGKAITEVEMSEKEQPALSGHLSFSERLYQRAVQYNIPISGGFELTQRCHLKCVHCYIDNRPIGYSKELTTTEVFTLLNQIAESGCLWLLITGGEPFLRKDFADIYCHAKKLGMIVTIFTSATNLTRQVADIFVKYPPFLVEATLHGSTETTFDAITGVNGSFRQFRRGIQLLRERNIPFHLKMMVMRKNLPEVESARQLAIELGAGDFRFDPKLNADFLHSIKVRNLRITVEEAVKLDLLEPYKNRWERAYRKALKEQVQRPISRNLLFPCRAGKCSFTVSAEGMLLPCILIREPAYNLRVMSFSEAWNRLSRDISMAGMREDNSCRTCSVQTCSRCPAWGYLEYGDPDLKSEFACALQKEREIIFHRK